MSIFSNAKNLSDLETLWSAFTTNEVVALDDIAPNMQMRVRGTDQTVVDDYVAKLENGVVFPPLDVFLLPFNGVEQIILADGYHRFFAMQKAGVETVEVRCFSGRTWDEAEMFASFANVKNGKSASKDDITRAIGRLLSLEGAMEKFVVKAKLDVKSIAKWIGVHDDTARDLTKDIRMYVEWMRDTQIEILKEEGLSNRKIAEVTGVSSSAVDNIVNAQKSARPENGQQEPTTPTKAPHPKSLFNTEAASEEETEWHLDDYFLDILKDEELPSKEKLEKLEEVNKRGWETLTRYMANEGKSKKDKKKPSRTERVASAIGAAVTAFNSLEEVNPDLRELAAYSESSAGLANDIVILSSYMETLSRHLSEKSAKKTTGTTLKHKDNSQLSFDIL